MQNKFKQWLINKGFKEYAESGKPSTAIDYAYRVNQVRMEENMTWDDMINNISTLILKYKPHAEKWDKGCRSHESVFNALKRFSEFTIFNIQ